MAHHHEHQHEKKTVNVIGGFLGAGKTTLANYILSHLPEDRVDILVREYGSVSIDDQLINVDPENIHIFPGVHLHQDPQILLYDYMHKLYEQTHSFDHLLVEASGLDTPETLVQLFFLGHMQTHYQLGSYIAVVDAEYGEINLDEFPVAVEQIAFADAIVLNKIDLATEEAIQKLEKRMRRINAMAPIYRATYGEVDLPKIMNIRLYDQLANLQPAAKPGEEAMDNIETIVLTETRPLDKEKVTQWITDLFMNNGPKFCAAKGFSIFPAKNTGTNFRRCERPTARRRTGSGKKTKRRNPPWC